MLLILFLVLTVLSLAVTAGIAFQEENARIAVFASVACALMITVTYGAVKADINTQTYDQICNIEGVTCTYNP